MMRTLCDGWFIILLLMKHVEIGLTTSTTTTTTEWPTTSTTTEPPSTTTTTAETTSTSMETSTPTTGVSSTISTTELSDTNTSTIEAATSKTDTSTADSETTATTSGTEQSLTTTSTTLATGTTEPLTSSSRGQSQTTTEIPTASTDQSLTTEPETTSQSENFSSTTPTNASISPTPSSAVSTATQSNSIAASPTVNSSSTIIESSTSSIPDISTYLVSPSLTSISRAMTSNVETLSTSVISSTTASAAANSSKEMPISTTLETTVSSLVTSTNIYTMLTSHFQSETTAYSGFVTLSVSSAMSTSSSLTISSTDSSGIISLVSTTSPVSTFSEVIPSSSPVPTDISPSTTDSTVPTTMLPGSSTIEPSKQPTPAAPKPTTTTSPTNMQLYYAVSGMTVAGIILILLIIIFLLRLKRRKSACFAVDMELYSSFDDRTEMEVLPFRPGPVKLADFAVHLERLHRNDGMLFAFAFNLLHDDSPNGVSSVSRAEKNEDKNRYANILAFDHSRVKLHPINDDLSTDYINANFIPGYTLTREYIATQGPLPATFDDFWRMVWEQNVETIIMLTKLIEHGNEKCDKYWPDVGNVGLHGNLIVTTKMETSTPDFTLRTIEIGKAGEETRTVRQYAFIKWPDMGCPEKTSTLLKFVRVVRRTGPKKDASPMVVHCSAGVGRTGTFIAVDHLLQHIRENDDIDVYNLILNMRKYRASMIQTEAQLVYIYECIKDYMMADDEEDEADSNDEDIEADDDDDEDEGVEADRMLKDWEGHDNPAFE